MAGPLYRAGKHPLTTDEFRSIVKVNRTWNQLVQDLLPMSEFEENSVFTRFPLEGWQGQGVAMDPIIYDSRIIAWVSRREGTIIYDREGKILTSNIPSSAESVVLDPVSIVGPAVAMRLLGVGVRSSVRAAARAGAAAGGAAAGGGAAKSGMRLSSVALALALKSARCSSRVLKQLERSLRYNTTGGGLLTGRITSRGVSECREFVQAKVVYLVREIIKYNEVGGKLVRDAVIAEAHRKALLHSAISAEALGQKTFHVVGNQCNKNFLTHLKELAQKYGEPSSFRTVVGNGGPTHPDAIVTLSARKIINSNGPDLIRQVIKSPPGTPN